MLFNVFCLLRSNIATIPSDTCLMIHGVLNLEKVVIGKYKSSQIQAKEQINTIKTLAGPGFSNLLLWDSLMARQHKR